MKLKKLSEVRYHDLPLGSLFYYKGKVGFKTDHDYSYNLETGSYFFIGEDEPSTTTVVTELKIKKKIFDPFKNDKVSIIS